MKKIIIITIILSISLGWLSPIKSAMEGGSYNIPYDSFSISEGDRISAGDYTVDDTVGDFAAHNDVSGNYNLIGGLRGIDAGSLSYSLSKSSIAFDFGTGDPTQLVATDEFTIGVTTDSVTGYSLSLTESGNLASGANDIDDVSDGSVTAGSEEYGIRTVDGNGLLATDTPISGTVNVALSNTPVTSSNTRVLFRAAVSSATKAGTYSHTLTFTINVNP